MPQGHLHRASLIRHLTESIWQLTLNAHYFDAFFKVRCDNLLSRWSIVPLIISFTCTCKINKSSRYAARHTLIGEACFQEQFADDVAIFVSDQLRGGAVGSRLPEHQTLAIEGCYGRRDLAAWRQRIAAKTNRAALADMVLETEFEEPRKDRRHKRVKGNGSGRESCSDLYHAAAVSGVNFSKKNPKRRVRIRHWLVC